MRMRSGELSRQRRLVFDAIALGVVGAAAAALFNVGTSAASWLFLGKIAQYVPPTLATDGGAVEQVGRFGLWMIPVSCAIGGLLVGLLVERFAPEAEGHGTDSVIKAFHRAGGYLRPRVPPVKLLASAITIGSGGSAGREGPVAMVAAGVGSWYATFMKRDERDRRTLLLVGMAAGLSASFRSPIGTALMAIEVLYSEMEFESYALLYTTLAAIVAYAVNGVVVGWEPLFRLTEPITRLARPVDYLWFIVLGVMAGVVGTFMPAVFYGVRDWFNRLSVPRIYKPAIGGFAAGLIAVAFPQVVSGGYGWMQQAIDGKLLMGTLLALVIAKTLAMSLTVGSGGSGGVFAPALYIGAMLGGACASVAHLAPAPFVIVGMAAVFAGAARVPIATMMMVTEMTGGYTLLVPAALAVMLSYLVESRLSQRFRYCSIYEAQVATRGDSPAHHTRHLDVALRLLQEKKITDFSHLGEVNLVSLLRSGIPVELPGDRRMVVGTIRESSRLSGTTIAQSGRAFGGGDGNIVAMVRGERMLKPRASMELHAGDRIVAVVDEIALAELASDLDPW
jgi:CIC family chloride channel protein